MSKTTLAIITNGGSSLSRANEFGTAALNQGYDARVVLLSSSSIVKDIEQADKVIYGVGPKQYNSYSELVADLSAEKANNLDAVLTAFDKIKTFYRLENTTIAMPKTWIIDRNSDWDRFPIVIKAPRSNRGEGVVLVTNRQTYKQVTQQLFLDNPQLLCQEFIEESRGNDKRIIATKHRCIAAMERRAQTGDFRANIHLGASAKPYQPTEYEIEIATKAVAALQLDYGGVDIIDSERGPLVLEVNPSPGLAISSITGIDVAAEIIREVMDIQL